MVGWFEFRSLVGMWRYVKDRRVGSSQDKRRERGKRERVALEIRITLLQDLAMSTCQ